jgi:hypothetical protein
MGRKKAIKAGPVQERFAKAQVYNDLLGKKLVSGAVADSPVAVQVEAEIQAFIQERLQVLMGVKVDMREHPELMVTLAEIKLGIKDVQKRTEQAFNAEQQVALSKLADAVLTKASQRETIEASQPGPQAVPQQPQQQPQWVQGQLQDPSYMQQPGALSAEQIAIAQSMGLTPEQAQARLGPGGQVQPMGGTRFRRPTAHQEEIIANDNLMRGGEVTSEIIVTR